MFNKGNMGNLMRQAQKMQEDLQKAQENLVHITVEGNAGGSMVVVTANAAQEVLQIKINPEVVDPQDVDMLEDLVLAAVNQALQNSRAKAEEELGKVTGGMGPGLLGGMKLPGF